ncbi:DMT family transporter [Paenibacillus glycanilyticus]|uniref:Multidrug transporter n=1 Tax=Paenibacillus glycanilyticus TaxID=126569 RepID=A0ABQ6GH23_9BACL|nr:EamA family transporter [Paenibacillus glycanilyticus]GLX70249.1 multidrug transporter [Paenibacillus glycanilyticus]
MNRASKSFSAYELLYIVGIVAISFSSIFIKWSNAESSVIGMYRLYLTILIMLPLAWKYKQELLYHTPRQLLLLLGSGVMLALHFLLWMSSLKYTTVASSTIFLALEPVLVMLGSYLIFKTKANKIMLLGMGIAMVGTVIIGSSDLALSQEALYGDVLSILGTIAVAVHMLIGKQLRSNTSAFAYNFIVFFIAATTLAIYNLIQGYKFTGYSSHEWGIFLLLAIVPTLFGHYLFNWLLKYMNATAVSMSVLGEPVIASLLAWALLKEALTGWQLGAGIVILFGVWLFMRHGKE